MIGKNCNTEQEELFENWNFICSKMRDLSCFIQNDFVRMKSDNYIINKDISNYIINFESGFNKTLLELTKVKADIILFLNKISTE